MNEATLFIRNVNFLAAIQYKRPKCLLRILLTHEQLSVSHAIKEIMYNFYYFKSYQFDVSIIFKPNVFGWVRGGGGLITIL